MGENCDDKNMGLNEDFLTELFWLVLLSAPIWASYLYSLWP